MAREEEGEAQWSLSALARTAQEAGILGKCSQVRRMLLREQMHWRNTQRGASIVRRISSAIRTAIVIHSTEPARSARRPSAPTISDQERPAPLPRRLAGRCIKVPLDYGPGPEKTYVYGVLRIRDGKEITLCSASHNFRKHNV